jgi:hypothetical protein
MKAEALRRYKVRHQDSPDNNDPPSSQGSSKESATPAPITSPPSHSSFVESNPASIQQSPEQTANIPPSLEPIPVVKSENSIPDPESCTEATIVESVVCSPEANEETEKAEVMEPSNETVVIPPLCIPSDIIPDDDQNFDEDDDCYGFDPDLADDELGLDLTESSDDEVYQLKSEQVESETEGQMTGTSFGNGICRSLEA